MIVVFIMHNVHLQASTLESVLSDSGRYHLERTNHDGEVWVSVCWWRGNPCTWIKWNHDRELERIWRCIMTELGRRYPALTITTNREASHIILAAPADASPEQLSGMGRPDDWWQVAEAAGAPKLRQLAWLAFQTRSPYEQN